MQLNSESERAFNGKNCGPNLSVGDERLSDNVGSVNQFLAALQRAHKEERHFALVDDVAFAVPSPGSFVIHSGEDARSDPRISSVKLRS
ncbi:MAG: hypothetical protein QOH31_5047 [Verrucomicrobiota bacterium]